MATGETSESVLLAALGEDGWHCEGTRELAVPLDGIAGGDAAAGPGLRLYWIERAMCSLSWGAGQEVLVMPGSIIAMPRSTVHRLKPCADVGLAWALTAVWPTSPWCASLLLNEGAVLHQAIGAADAPESMRAVRARTLEPGAAAAPAQALMLDRCARDVATLAIGHAEYSPGHSALGAALAHARLGPWLREVLALSGQLPDIDACAERCNLSRAAFTRRVAEITGASYLDFVTRWRMNIALHRLVLAGDTVADLSERCGYESEASFRKAFRRATGVTPGAARAAKALDVALGMQQGSVVVQALPAGRAAADLAPPPVGRPAPAKISVSTHTSPPDLASLLTGVISSL